MARYSSIKTEGGGIIMEDGLPLSNARTVELLNQLDDLDERIADAMKVYDIRKEAVEGFANKTATDMYEALQGGENNG